MVIDKTYEKIVKEENRNIFTYVDFLFSCGINKWSKDCMNNIMTYFDGKSLLNGIDLIISFYDDDIEQWGFLTLKTEDKGVMRLWRKSPIFNGVELDEYDSTIFEDMVDVIKGMDLFKTSDAEMVFTPNEFVFDIIRGIIKEEDLPHLHHMEYAELIDLNVISETYYESQLDNFKCLETHDDDDESEDDDDGYDSSHDEDDGYGSSHTTFNIDSLINEICYGGGKFRR